MELDRDREKEREPLQVQLWHTRLAGFIILFLSLKLASAAAMKQLSGMKIRASAPDTDSSRTTCQRDEVEYRWCFPKRV